MRSPDEWLAEFAGRGERFRAERAAFHRYVGDRLAAERAPADAPASPVVLVVGGEAPRSAVGLLALAHSLGWVARLVASAAAHPTKGYVEVVTLRFRRHDERGFAAWWNGAYECGWFVGPDGLEPLAGTRMRSRRAPKSGATMIRGVHDVIEGIRLTRHDVAMTDGVI